MQLYFIRHGIAVDLVEANVKEDCERWLSDKGIHRMEKSARGLRKLVREMECLFTSPIVRAVQTANLIAQTYDPPPPVMETAKLKPGAVLSDIEKLTHQLTDKGAAGFVGHEPDLSRIVAELIAGTNPEAMDMRKGSVCRIDVSGAPLPGSGKLIWLLQPRFLRLLAD